MEKNMITYTKNEMVGITKLGKSLGNYLDKVKSNVFNKIAIIRRNKPEAVILSIDEYELLQKAYDMLEQKEIEKLLSTMSKDDKDISHSKTLKIQV